jgi:hypothetical protein
MDDYNDSLEPDSAGLTGFPELVLLSVTSALAGGYRFRPNSDEM